MTQPLLAIENLSIRFCNQSNDFLALDKVNLHIAHGETLALVGGSGSGKTLTGLAILQILPLTAELSNASKILLDGEDLLSASEIILRKIRGKRIGMIFQEAITAFNPVLTIHEQIDEVLKQHLTLSSLQRKQRVLSLLHEVGIPDPLSCAQSYPHTLSGGMRQRAMIAMALAPEPDLIIADEPTTAVDVTIQAQILALLRSIQQRTNMAMLFITHDLGIVRTIADRIAVISQGKIV
jgi:microcin C transport system ATP-binding protein